MRFLEKKNILLFYDIEGKNGWTSPTWGDEKYPTATWDGKVIPHEHEYLPVATAPTCTEKGDTTSTCTLCGDSYTDTFVPALGHACDNGTVTKEPSATQSGIRTFTCTRCGATQTETFPATGEQTDQPCDGKLLPQGNATRAQVATILMRYIENVVNK